MMGAVQGLTIDEPRRAALARLTAAEKECLRRRLHHQTAKEMALDLGISPHAVEKRLKMARTKLGLSSSLEAARLLAEAEGYQPTGPQAADLDPNPGSGDKPASRSTIIGVLAMSLVLAAAAALVLAQPAGESAAPSAEQSAPPSPSTSDEKPDFGMGDLGNVAASPERARHYVQQMFEQEDTDHSGYIERAEGPSRVAVGEPRPAGSSPRSYSETHIAKVLEGDAAWAEYLRTFDTNGDGRISFEEYAAQKVSYYEQRGIPLIPADWPPAPSGKH